jgi:membrane protein required for colicin V production
MIGWLDIVLAVVLLAAVIAGLVKGLIKELVGVTAAVGGFLAAASWYGPVAERLDRTLHSATVSKFLGFVLVFAVILIAGAVVAWLLSKLMVGPLKFANHLFGAIFGLLEGMIIAGALVFALMVFPINREALTDSRLAPYCYGLTKTMVELIPQDLKDRFTEAYREIAKKSGSVDGKEI